MDKGLKSLEYHQEEDFQSGDLEKGWSRSDPEVIQIDPEAIQSDPELVRADV